MQSGLSIIVCSYNPQKEIFERVLNAIKEAGLSAKEGIEYLIVDNNSLRPLENEEYVQQFLAQTKNSKVIVELKQGLTSARIRGIEEATRNWLLFIDDDNEIDRDFFVQTQLLIKKLPFVAAFNAGVIRVEYIGEVDEWFMKKGKSHFQESNISSTVWGNDSKSFHHWPFGTGMLIRKDVCDCYLDKVKRSIFTLTDRNGTVLTSGGDGQLISCALELGFGVGRSKELRLNHLISSNKATVSYLKRMDYGIYYSNEWFLKECFPEHLVLISRIKEIKLISRTIFLQGIKTILKGDYKIFSIQMASIAGRLDGNRAAFGKKRPAWLRILSKNYV